MYVDYYSVMGLPRSATTSEIKARYKLLAKRHHPDHEGDASTMSLVNRSYSVLANPKLRFEYNQLLPKTDNRQSPAKQAPRPDSRPNRSVNTPPVYPKQRSKLRFSPFASVSLVALVVLGLAILGFLHQNNTIAFNPSGSTAPNGGTADSGNSSQSSGGTATPINPTPQTTPAYSTGNISDPTSVTTPAYSNDAQTCDSQQSQSYQQAATIEQEINATESQLAKLARTARRDGRNSAMSAEQSSYVAQYQQLEQQLFQYQSQLVNLQTSDTAC